MALNLLGTEKKIPAPAPVTLPKLSLPDPDEQEIAEAAAAITERRIIRKGLDAWQAIGKADTFEAWVKIGSALAVGRDFALRTSGANRPAGGVYCRAFSKWVEAHGFSEMKRKLRSEALELHTHINEITAWRATLDERERRRLRLPQANVTRWRNATQQAEPMRTDGAVGKAEAAWRRFVACVEVLPANEAARLRETVRGYVCGVINL